MRTSRIMTAIGLTSALVAGTATARAAVVYSNYYASGYSPSQVQLASASGETLAVILGQPFANDPGNAGVVAAMQGQNPGPKLHFTQTPRPDDKYGYKVVMAFGGVAGGYGTLCKVPSDGYVRASSPTEVSAAFCVGHHELSYASAWTSSATSPNDPNFRSMMRDVLTALTPPNMPYQHKHCVGRMC